MIDTNNYMIPKDLTSLVETPWPEVEKVLRLVASSAAEADFSDLTALLVDRTLRILRRGGRDDYLAEALGRHRFLESDSGQALRASNLEYFGCWLGLARLLSAASRKSDRASVDAILRSYASHGRKLLEFLAAAGAAVRRSEIRSHLGILESRLSHLLRDLEQADLIVRYRTKGSKEVMVELGPAGSEVVDTTIFPPWVEYIAEAITQRTGNLATALDRESLAAELLSKGVPSLLAARKIAEVLCGLGPAETAAAGLAFIEQYQNSDFQNRVRNSQGAARPLEQLAESAH